MATGRSSSSVHWFSSGIGHKKMRNCLNHGKRNSEGNKSAGDEAGGVSAGLSGFSYCLRLGGGVVADRRHSKGESR